MTKVYQVVVYHEVNDPEKLSAYAELAGPAMKSAGATFLARGIPYLVREEGTATRTVLIEWPSREAADQTCRRCPQDVPQKPACSPQN